MTTEVVVANRLGIALATDSAVTITGGGHLKVFDTADKLFELSAKHPVAVMINGNMDCVGTPWEILVKDFREKEGAVARGSIEKWAHDFLAYVESHEPNAEEVEGGFIDRVIRSEIRTVQQLVLQVVSKFVSETARASNHILTKKNLDVRKVLALAIQFRNEHLSSIPVAISLQSVTREALLERYGERIRNHLEKMYLGQKLTEEEQTSLTWLVVDALHKAAESDFGTGIVVAGYGADDTFPAVFSAEVSGRVAGKLKILKEAFSPIASCKHGGVVTTFAQADVTERLLKGADVRFVKHSAEFIETAVSDAMTKAFTALDQRKLSKKAIRAREKMVSEMAEAAGDEYRQKAVEKIKENFSRDFEGMIAMMPKQELIEFAEALVSITAIERKATADEGTVGGPVDVAMITKHEGFVWIKRKHYFQRDLNPRYFARKFGGPPLQGSP